MKNKNRSTRRCLGKITEVPNPARDQQEKEKIFQAMMEEYLRTIGRQRSPLFDKKGLPNNL